ncbi:CoA pyrophosphatase [Solimonas terrae]|uniref:CoA pyrophosphatase n=1 Tax=Solimonas terrae TaxID=1396819 RepID=A0A6M2BU45_9GAMM|nr:CoA pyrophosphatase [Solimonas terrae]NGY06126.1 CoA pyrophosphatase [Solimonas terrae]
MSELERRLRAALADTHLETPRAMVSLGMPEMLGRLFDATLLANLRPSAVLLPLIRRGERLSMLLTVRSAKLRSHGGQIAFPGGARDAADVTAVDNALREAQEEVGLDPATVEIIGYLDDYPTLSRFRITPVVGIVDAEPVLAIDADEVAEVFEVPFEILASRRNFVRKILSRDGINVPFFELQWQQHRVWGATAGMLWDLAGRMESA